MFEIIISDEKLEQQKAAHNIHIYLKAVDLVTYKNNKYILRFLLSHVQQLIFICYKITDLLLKQETILNAMNSKN